MPDASAALTSLGFGHEGLAFDSAVAGASRCDFYKPLSSSPWGYTLLSYWGFCVDLWTCYSWLRPTGKLWVLDSFTRLAKKF